MSAKQILQYVTNRSSEEEAARILHSAGVVLTCGIQKINLEADGRILNSDKQVTICPIGQITAFELPSLKKAIVLGAKVVSKIDASKIDASKIDASKIDASKC